MKPFDLEKALAWEPVMTRGGERVSDLWRRPTASAYPLSGNVGGCGLTWLEDGRYQAGLEDEYDLFMADTQPPDSAIPAGPLTEQVGGNHYKQLAIQPVEFIEKNKLSFLEGCVIKRVCRHRDKNGAEDIKKAIHELRLILQLEYGETETKEGK